MDANAVVADSTDKVMEILDTIQSIAVTYGMKAIGAIAVLIIGMWLAKLLTSLIKKAMDSRKVDPTLTGFVGGMAHVAMQAFVVIAALGILDIPVASFVAVLGAAGLAVGLALQGSLSNFAAGVLMIIFKPFRLGDFVEAGGATGSVQEIGIFTTVLNSPDNKKMIVPNSQVMGGKITNFNANGTRRVDLVAGISYSDDIDKAKSLIEGILAADERVLKDPKPTVAVVEMADSSVDLVVRPWCTGENYWGVYFDTTEAIKKKFDEADITIPFPQRDVHIYEHKEK